MRVQAARSRIKSLFTLTIVLTVIGLQTPAGANSVGPRTRTGVEIVAVGAENQYANVIGQIGGKYVAVTAIVSNPNIDPHSFEASPKVAQVVSAASLVVQNGLGYDSYMNKIEQASPNARRKVIDVQNLLGLPDSTENPHLWYKPTTMTAVAKAIAADLAVLDPPDSGYFNANVTKFDDSLKPWLQAIAMLKASHPGAPVATTEPVGDYMIQAAGLDNETPWTLQADVMNGVDPSPQNVAFEESLFARHQVKAFLYNEQVTDSLTETFLADAKDAGIPVVGLYETMPTPGFTYQSWMIAEVNSLQRALSHKQSTAQL